jgi:predicted DNA-binding transcriptional regulator AlpA
MAAVKRAHNIEDKEGRVTLQEAKKYLKQTLGSQKPVGRPNPMELLKVSEAADLCGVHPKTLWRRIQRGELRAWGSPRRVRIADVLWEFEPPQPPSQE